MAELKAVRALSAAGTACRTHTVGAEMAVRANLIPAVEAVLAAVLADGRTGGTAIAADTGRRTAAAFVAVAAPGFVVAVAALTDSAVGAKGVIAVAAMLAAVPADRCAILAAVAADTGVHAAAAGAAVVAPAVVLHALLAAAAVSAEIAIAVLAMLSAFRTHLTALFAGLPTDTDNGTGVTTSAALTVFIRAVGTHTALGTEFIPAVAAALAAVRAEIRAFLAAVAAARAGDGAGVTAQAVLTVVADTVNALAAIGAELIPAVAAVLAAGSTDIGAAVAAVAADAGIRTSAAQITVGAPVVARAVRADRSAVVAKVICTHAFVAGTTVVVLIAAPAALSRQ